MTYYNRVLDWPSAGYDGQIEHRLETTFATTTNRHITSSDANTDYGDIRIVPMLERIGNSGKLKDNYDMVVALID